MRGAGEIQSLGNERQMNHSATERKIGRVAGLWRYPVKSMAGEPLAGIDVSWQGFDGDRRWAFVRSGVARSGFPWLTIRENAAMARYVASFTDPARPNTSPTMVRTPGGVVMDVLDPALAGELSPSGAHVIRHDRGLFDTFPLSLISTQTLAETSRLVDEELDVRRFRPNILIDGVDGAPFFEDILVGSVLRIGSLRMRIDKRDGRCAVITIDPTTLERSPAVLRVVAEQRQGCLGVYGTTVSPGHIAMDDTIYVEAPDANEAVRARFDQTQNPFGSTA